MPALKAPQTGAVLRHKQLTKAQAQVKQLANPSYNDILQPDDENSCTNKEAILEVDTGYPFPPWGPSV